MAEKTEGDSVIESLKELWPDFQLSKYDQMHPTSDIAIKFYERFICGQLQIVINEVQQNLVHNSSCHEAFRDILSVYALYMCTDCVINKLGLKEMIETFGLTDLLTPKRKRFKLSLLLLSNCVLYATGIQEQMEEIKNKIIDDMKNIEDIGEKINIVSEKINELAMTRAKNLDKKEEYEENKASFKKQIESLQETIDQKNGEISTSKNELSLIQDQFAKVEKELKELSTIRQQLQTQVVDDANSIINERECLVKEISELKQQSVGYEANMNSGMQKITCHTETRDIINQFLQTNPLNSILEKYELLSKYKNEVEKVTDELKTLQAEENEHQANIKQINDENHLLVQNILAFGVKHASKMENYDKEIEQLENEYKLEQEKNNRDDKIYKTLQKKYQHVQDCCDQYKQHIEEQDKYYEQQYFEILALKGELDNKVNNVIQLAETELDFTDHIDTERET